jgi:integrase
MEEHSVNKQGTIAELCRMYLEHYRATHKPNSNGNQRENAALHRLQRSPVPPVAGDQYAGMALGSMPITALSRKIIRHALEDMDRSGTMRRATVNQYLRSWKRAIRFAMDRDMIPEQHETSVASALSLSSLRVGQSYSAESTRVHSPPAGDIDRFIAQAKRCLAVMVHVQRYTGMRGQNLVAMRLSEIDRTGKAWLYEPANHKTSHLGRKLIIPIGPIAQQALRPWIEDHPSRDRLFTSPRGLAYDSDSYRQAVNREQDRLGIPRFNPHQLRHAFATDIARRGGRDAAQVLLGHSSPVVTERYIDLARRDELAALAERLG